MKITKWGSKCESGTRCSAARWLTKCKCEACGYFWIITAAECWTVRRIPWHLLQPFQQFAYNYANLWNGMLCNLVTINRKSTLTTLKLIFNDETWQFNNQIDEILKDSLTFFGILSDFSGFIAVLNDFLWNFWRFFDIFRDS